MVNSDNGNISLSLNNKPIGLEYLVIKNNTISLSANARIFRENYKQGFCLNTLDKFTNHLKNCGLELYSNYAKETNLSLVHVKNDVEVGFQSLSDDLALIENSKYFKVQRDNSITFENKNKGDLMSIIFYDKHNEMTKKNRPKYKGLNMDFDQFIGLSRIETKLNNWRTVKKILGTRNMMDIMEQKNINYLALINILKDQPMEIPQLDLSQFKTISQLDDYARTKLLFEHCDGDITAIQRQIERYIGKNTKPTYQMKKVKKMLPLVQSPEGRIMKSIIKLKEQLKE